MRLRSGGLALALAVAACGGDDEPRFALDGSPRVPDDEGIVTAVDFESLTLDGERTYEVDRDLIAFSALDLGGVALVNSEGQYVQVGTDGDEVVWLGTIAEPIGDEPFVLFTGEVERFDGDTVEFSNGTVLRADPSLALDDAVGEDVRVAIDPETKTVTEVL